MARTKKRRRLRFSLTALLLALTAISLWLGWQTYLWRRQKAVVNAVVAAEGIVIFDDDSRSTPTTAPGQQSSALAGLRRSLGEDYFRTVKTVDFATNNGRRTGTREPKATETNLALLASLPDVETLELGHGEAVDDATLVHIRGLRNLKILYLYHTRVRGRGLAHLVDLPKLQSLSLSRTPLIDEGLVHLGKMSRLRWLQLQRTHITDAGLAHISRLKTLEELSLSHTDITDEGLSLLGSLTRLKSLNLTHTNVTADGVQRIRQILPRCNVSVGFGLGQAPIDFQLFPDDRKYTANEVNVRFKELGIDGHVRADPAQPDGPITDIFLGQITFSDKSALSLLENMPQLKQLTIRGALVGDEFVGGLASSKQLEYLELSNMRIAGPGLAALAKLTKLRELVLNNCRLSDEAIPHLMKLTNLKQLQLDDTRISDEGLNRLKQALPDCRIY